MPLAALARWPKASIDGPSGSPPQSQAKDAQASTYACGPITPNSGKPFFAVTIGLQAQTGGSLVETLSNLQDLVSKRVAMAKRGKALAAEARMSAMVIGALPFVMSLVFYFIRPGFFQFFFNTPTGNHLLLAACGFMGMGILMMRQMISRSLAL